MLFPILLLTFVSVSTFVLVFFPTDIFSKKKDEEEEENAMPNFLYQIKPLLVWLGKKNAKLKLQRYENSIQKKMVAAGEPLDLTVDEFISLCELSAVVGAILFSLMFAHSFGMTFFGGILGFAFPNLWLKEAVAKRRLSIVRQLPDFLDILTLAVEAGLDFGAALQKVVSVTKRSPMVDEFRFMMQEMRLGTTRYNALKNLALRIDVSEVTGFVSSLQQADQMGVSLGPTLRIQADQMRIKRMQRAEKAGGEASVKMLIPLILFIFPAVFIMLFGPIIIRLLSKGF